MGKRAKKVRRPRPGATPPQKRQPVAGAKVGDLKKRPVPGPGGEPQDDACLVFGLQLLDPGGQWAWSATTPDHVKTIAEACKGWESMKPSEVFASSGNKPISHDSLCSEARARLLMIELDDHELWELRLSSKARLWGVRARNVFYIVWWDPSHTVCPARKRHT
jgi:hypothetical protein